MVNEKYSYNGYKPKSNDALAKIVSYQRKRNLYFTISNQLKRVARDDSLAGILTKEQIFKKFRDSLKVEAERAGAFSPKQYSKAVTDMKICFQKKTLSSRPASEFNNTEIIGTNFSQKEPFTDVFPASMTGVTFTRCNLGNCNIPAGCTVNGGFQGHYEVQNDLEDWLIDAGRRPIKPMSKEFKAYGISEDPNDIPKTKLDKAITKTKSEDIENKRLEDKIKSIANNPLELAEFLKKRKL